MSKIRALLFGSVFLATALSSAAKIPEGADTPQALVDRLLAAAKKGDGYELAACTLPDDRNAIAGSLVYGTTMMVGAMDTDEAHRAEGKKYRAELDTIFKKYGVDKNLRNPDSVLRKEGAPDFSSLVKGADNVGLSGDLLKFVRSLPGMSGEGPFAAFTRISDLKVDGEKATAAGADGPLEFLKVGDRWYVHVAPPTSESGDEEEGPETD